MRKRRSAQACVPQSVRSSARIARQEQIYCRIGRCLTGGAVKISAAVCRATGDRFLMGKKRKKMRGTVEKIIKPVSAMEPEKAQITIPEADDLYREVRVENVVTDESGEKAGLKPGAEVDVIVEADSSATMKKP